MGVDKYEKYMFERIQIIFFSIQLNLIEGNHRNKVKSSSLYLGLELVGMKRL